MSEKEKQIVEALNSQIDKLDAEQRKELKLIAQGMALEAERRKDSAKEE
ncbi:MAG: hypothetical protein J6R01_08190 [Alistipes sp.]|nr:hypothetical protein [Alistipes sp.]